MLVSSCRDHYLNIWELNSGEIIKSLRSELPHRSVVVINEDKLVSEYDDNTLKIWDYKSGNVIKTLYGHSGFIVCIAKIDENTIISGSIDKTLRIWEVNSGEEIETLTGHDDMIVHVDTSKGMIVSNCWQTSFNIWRPSLLVKGIDQRARCGGGGGGNESLF